MQGLVWKAAMRKWDTEMSRWLESSILIVWIDFTEQEMTVARMRQRDRMHVLVKHWLMVGPCNGSSMTHLMDWHKMKLQHFHLMISRNARSWQENKMRGPLPGMWLKESITSQVQLEITCNHFWPHTRMHSFSSTQNNYANLFRRQIQRRKTYQDPHTSRK